MGIKADPRQLCRKCASSLVQVVGEHDYLRPTQGPIEVLYSLGPYGSEPLTTLIHKAKYQQKDWIFEALRRAFKERLPALGLQEAVDVVCAVPLHPSRLRERGFNQAQIIARMVALYINRPVQGLLRRVKATKPQAGLSDGQERKANMRRAFSVSEDCKGTIQGRRVLLVDDVATTGATLNECAQILRNQGASRIFAFVLASAMGKEGI